MTMALAKANLFNASEEELSVGQMRAGDTIYDFINGRQLERRNPASAACQNSFTTIDNDIAAVEQSPEQRRVGESAAFAAWASALRTLHAADCGGEEIAPQPNDSAECASLRQQARLAEEQLRTSEEFTAWRQMPQWLDIANTITRALSDDCYLDVTEATWRPASVDAVEMSAHAPVVVTCQTDAEFLPPTVDAILMPEAQGPDLLIFHGTQRAGVMRQSFERAQTDTHHTWTLTFPFDNNGRWEFVIRQARAATADVPAYSGEFIEYRGNAEHRRLAIPCQVAQEMYN